MAMYKSFASAATSWLGAGIASRHGRKTTGNSSPLLLCMLSSMKHLRTLDDVGKLSLLARKAAKLW